MVLVPMLGSRFQTRIVSSLEHVTNEPAGRTPFMPSLDDGYASTPQMHAAWYRNECDLPTWKENAGRRHYHPQRGHRGAMSGARHQKRQRGNTTKQRQRTLRMSVTSQRYRLRSE